MQVKIKAHINAQCVEAWDESSKTYVKETKFYLFPYDMSDAVTSYVHVDEQEVTVDIPDGFDIRSGLLENLEAEKKKAAAEYQKRVTELNAQIQSLMAIEG